MFLKAECIGLFILVYYDCQIMTDWRLCLHVARFAVFSSVHLDNESLGINHPDLFQTLFLSEPLLLHGHGDQLSNPHRCLGVAQSGRNQCRQREYLI